MTSLPNTATGQVKIVEMISKVAHNKIDKSIPAQLGKFYEIEYFLHLYQT